MLHLVLMDVHGLNFNWIITNEMFCFQTTTKTDYAVQVSFRNAWEIVTLFPIRINYAFRLAFLLFLNGYLATVRLRKPKTTLQIVSLCRTAFTPRGKMCICDIVCDIVMFSNIWCVLDHNRVLFSETMCVICLKRN